MNADGELADTGPEQRDRRGGPQLREVRLAEERKRRRGGVSAHVATSAGGRARARQRYGMLANRLTRCPLGHRHRPIGWPALQRRRRDGPWPAWHDGRDARATPDDLSERASIESGPERLGGPPAGASPSCSRARRRRAPTASTSSTGRATPATTARCLTIAGPAGAGLGRPRGGFVAAARPRHRHGRALGRAPPGSARSTSSRSSRSVTRRWTRRSELARALRRPHRRALRPAGLPVRPRRRGGPIG